MDLKEHLDDCMIDHLRSNYDDLLEDVKYTFEHDVDDISLLPRDIKVGLDEINLEWVIENHIECCGYEDAIQEGIWDYAEYHADCDEIICEYGIIRAIEDYYESGYTESQLAYDILINGGYDYTSGDIYEAIYEDAVEYICDELAEWYMSFTTHEIVDVKSFKIVCDNHDIDYTIDSPLLATLHTYDLIGSSKTINVVFSPGYKAVRINGMDVPFDKMKFSEDNHGNEYLDVYNSDEMYVADICVWRVKRE